VSSVESTLASQSMRWRMIVGIGSWSIALAASAFVGLASLGVSFVHVDGLGRLVTYTVPAIVSFVVAGYVLLRVGEIDLATGKLVRAAPVPWSRIAIFVSIMAIIAGAVIAWPLGVYTSVRASRSPCGMLVPIATAQRYTPESLSYALASFDDGCDVGMAARGHAALAVLIRERAAPDDREWHALMARFHADGRDAITIAGVDEAWLLENDDALVIAMRVGREGRFVQLRRDVFDRADALAIAETIGR
jgi:hypothetical protein